jgi:outer membrane protein OmpA-like peptidoglycan-associated protein
MKTLSKILLAGILIMLTSVYLEAQIDIEGKIKQKVKDRAEQRVDEGIDKVLDSTEEGIEEAVKNDEKEGEEETDTEETTEREKPTSEPKPTSEETSKQPDTASPAFASYSKYDFIPGEKVILFEDFTQDNIGEFPALWNTDATGEVMSTNLYPGKWFKPMGDGMFLIEKSLTLPDNFTIEFDVIPTFKEGSGSCDFIISLYDQAGMDLNADIFPGTGGFNINFSDNVHTFSSYGENTDESAWISGESYSGLLVPEKLNKIKIWVQKQRIRIYMEEKKVFDLPRGVLTGYHYNHFRISTRNRGGEPLVSNIRFAAGRPDLRNKLLTEGKLITYGIYFDSGKDIVKPESYATLKEIASILQENPTLRIKIAGHTDSDGENAANLDLSKKRALSVKNSLVKDFVIDAARIETDGKGETEPIASNSTAEGKAGNRRVEIIKL